MSSDAKWIVGAGLVSLAIIGSAWILSYALIEMLGGIRADLRDLRDSVERAACGELARGGGAGAEPGHARQAGSSGVSPQAVNRGRALLPSASCERRDRFAPVPSRGDASGPRPASPAPLPVGR
ncbi:MAG: hypothetical protein OXH75_10870 [Acidobacteria bacterium]|nr:hypothetical protein [Acidobacteriota bacterium]